MAVSGCHKLLVYCCLDGVLDGFVVFIFLFGLCYSSEDAASPVCQDQVKLRTFVYI